MNESRIIVPVSIRERKGGMIIQLIQEGRAATGGRTELFAPGSLIWDSTGIAVRTRHHAPSVGRAFPRRGEAGEISISIQRIPELVERYEQGARHASVEFVALEERTTQGGIREVQKALLTGVALTDNPEYDTSGVELRTRARRMIPWL